MALGFFCCCLLRSPKYGSSEDSETEPQESDEESPGKKSFISIVAAKPELQLYLLSKVFIYLAVTIPPLLVPSLLVQRGYSTDKAGYAMSILGITNVFGRLSGGLVDYITDHAIKICIFASLLSGVSVALMPVAILGDGEELPYFYICCALHGFFTGPLNSLYASCASLLMGTAEYQSYSGTIGMELLVYGLMTIIGPSFGGYLIDYYQGYKDTFYITGGCYGLSASCFIICEIIRPKYDNAK